MQFSSVRRIKPPEFEPLSLSEVKQHLRIMQGVNEDDAYLLGLISAVRNYFEARTGQTTTRTWWRAKVAGCWTCSTLGVELPYPPLSTAPDGSDGVTITWESSAADPADIVVDRTDYPGTIRYEGPDSPGCSEQATITWYAGVNSPEEIPQLWKTAMLVLLGHWYENRQAVITDSGALEVPMSFDLIIGACSYDGRG